MKKLLYLLWIVPCLIFGQGEIINIDGTNTLDGHDASYFLDTSSTAQAKSGNLSSARILVGDGTEALPSVSAINDPNTGFSFTGTDGVNVSLGGGARWKFASSYFYTSLADGPFLFRSGNSSTVPNIAPDYGDVNTGINNAGADMGSYIAGGKEGIRIDGVLGGIEIYLRDTTIFDNGAYISNEETDTLKITETVTKIEGDLHVTGNITQSHYGGMSYISTPGTQTIGTGGTFEKLYEGAMAYTAGHLDTFTESNGRLTYTGAVTKHFQILVFATIEGDEAAQLIQIRIAKDGTTIATTNQAVDFSAADSKNNINTGWLMELATNEYIEVYGTSDTSADTFEVQSLQIIINQMD